MYNSQPVRHLAQTLAVNSQYIPGPYEPFSGYHHFPGIADLPASAWNYAPREEFPFGYGTGSSPTAGQVSFSSAELSGTPTAASGGSFPTYELSDQDPFIFKRRPQETVRPTPSGEILLGPHLDWG